MLNDLQTEENFKLQLHNRFEILTTTDETSLITLTTSGESEKHFSWTRASFRDKDKESNDLHIKQAKIEVRKDIKQNINLEINTGIILVLYLKDRIAESFFVVFTHHMSSFNQI